jgi:enamine deaminase RidA (YjgF/YER057c/UK114 family)
MTRITVNPKELALPQEVLYGDFDWFKRAPEYRAPYSFATKLRPGKTLLLIAGAIPVNSRGEIVGKGDLKTQLKQVIENINIVVKEAGATLGDILRMNMYCRSEYVDEFIELAQWRSKTFPELFGANPTAHTLSGVVRMAHKDWIIEIDGFAEVPV